MKQININYFKALFGSSRVQRKNLNKNNMKMIQLIYLLNHSQRKEKTIPHKIIAIKVSDLIKKLAFFESSLR
jgi:hypothetical protein